MNELKKLSSDYKKKANTGGACRKKRSCAQSASSGISSLGTAKQYKSASSTSGGMLVGGISVGGMLVGGDVCPSARREIEAIYDDVCMIKDKIEYLLEDENEEEERDTLIIEGAGRGKNRKVKNRKVKRAGMLVGGAEGDNDNKPPLAPKQKKRKQTRSKNSWNQFVSEYYRQNKDKYRSFIEASKDASKLYKNCP